ncbi:ABC transporter ATP-binding protein [Oscillatoria sp. CS-180]|uniref:ABC transporter ATP-binding protein n=1 Tax=Oscillatoria sp. CS-180 TaxID=3021720 RepID=UPI00232B65B6|nr:ABC transporter ATP-binding protein [Oscillatoria sp. CS-180]MDB9528287.1 ABC transporter ATP-binding protein [Oscillatoria sp. CS-180]
MGNIQFNQVTLEFPGMSRPAVNQVTCDIAAGELVVILGPSGCGKTTLLKMVNRLYEPTSGQICIDGQDITRLRPTKLRQKIGYVIQQSGLFPHMTVAENVAVVPKLLRWPNPRTQARIDELLDLVKLPPNEYRDRYPAQLSGGQQQRVGIARALAGDPDYMLMDEPFGAIDAITRTSLQNEIIRLQQQLKKTILFVSHDVDEALRLGDRILVMNAGRIVQFDTPFNLLTQPSEPFVHELLGADDMVRQLGLLPVNSAMISLPEHYQNGNKPSVETADNLRDALSIILRTGAPELSVLEDGEPVGLLTLDHIRNCAVEANR